MISMDLSGAWSMRISGETRDFPATVPGSVYHDLLNAGYLEDPYWRDNETKALALMEHDFLYFRSFTAAEPLLSCGAVLLRCEGLDTLAEIRVNGVLAGNADNMHRVFELDVKNLLRAGENSIEIRFSSPTRYIREAYKTSRADGTGDAMTGFPLLRKAHCMFGWDWGPRLPDAGIWRDISLLGIDKARIAGVYVTQAHEAGSVALRIRTDVARLSPAPLGIAVIVTAPNGDVYTALGEDCELMIDEPALWWPNGIGKQPLYTVNVALASEGAVLDTWERRIGLRTLTMRVEKDEWGESFCHRVNGEDIFAMGADYIPEDSILPRVNPARTRRLLEDAAKANFNVIRVWGGGYYPDDFFYDACDELGLIVWQDFMFACAVYNLTDAFEENIRAEIADNVRRLRHHASLGLWCGNNEMEQFVAEGLWVSSPRQKADYIKMYEYVIPQVLKREDPAAFYWPASPSSGGSFDFPNGPDRGDVHYWQVWHGGLPFTDYRSHLFRYVSEFGFQSFPCMKTVEAFTEPADRNAFSYVMEKHQRNAQANGKIVAYLAQMYKYPRDLSTLVYASQLLQAQAVQYGVEHWRRNRGRCMGAVIWQLNDCWPVASWSSIDYFGRWKALHYYARRFFAPVLLSCHEEGVLSGNTNVNAEPFPLKKSARLNVSNETLKPFWGDIVWSLRRPDASIIEEGTFEAAVPPLSSVWLPEQNFSKEDEFGCYYSYRLKREGITLDSGSVLFCPPKHFRFMDPQLKATVSGNEITVTAQAYARSVEILCDADVMLSDNYFDMNGGERCIRILRGTAANVTVRSVYDIQ
ncbi:MAG TPA: glycoside hydrolase family 2 protein [Feifaniaceae bacterium]|nr:glycoside hydrolase family 2 protein [Feifaniaceae bacterium]